MLSDLILRLKNEAPGAFEELYREFSGKVYSTALHYLRQEQDAEEITQDVFLEVYRSVHEFRETALLSTWIYRITINKCLDLLRYKNRKKRFAFISALLSADDKLLHDPPDFIHPGVKAENREKAQHLHKALQRLPENQRTAFILLKIEGLSQQETSEIMKLGVKAVESLFQRAKANLRKTLSDFYEGK